MNLIQELRKFLKDNKIDYLLVNSTNEFLVEYTPLDENSRYLLTNFSGSAGDALISKDDIFLFVDGRYHQQADIEVDKNLVTVVKMKVGESATQFIVKKIKTSKTLGIVSKKNSQGRVEILEQVLKDKKTKIKLLDFDPILKKAPNYTTCSNIQMIDKLICGLSADEKFVKISKHLKPTESILSTNLEEVSYLCNLRDFSSNYSSKIMAKCLITKEKAVLFCDCALKVGDKFEIKNLSEFESYIQKSDNIEKIYVDKTAITAYDYSLVTNKAASFNENYIKKMKSVKTKQEIDHYKACFKRADKALDATRNFIEQNSNISEFDIAKNLEENFYKFGAKSLSFRSIVAKDKNSALAHYSKNSKTEIIKDGSLILIDCGAYYEGGYATDATRVFVKGEPNDLQKEVYTKVLKAFLKAFNNRIKTSTSGFSLDKAARDLLEKNKIKGFEFSHSLGHGLGISVHENPPTLACSPLAKTPLLLNMCFTIEPGLYNENYFGVRLENSCYIDKDGERVVIKSFSSMCFEKKLIDFKLLSRIEKNQLQNFEVK